MNSRGLHLLERPELLRPALVIAFEGWPDAGKVASGATSYMIDKLHAHKFAELRADDFYVYHTLGADIRNTYTRVQQGIIEETKLPSTTFWSYKNRSGGRDLIIATGHEPELRWNDYVNLMLDLSQELNVSDIYALGGTFDQVPHTIDPVISLVVNEPSLKNEFMKYGVGFTTYEGPCAVHTLLMTAAAQRRIPAVSLWGHTPHYIQIANTRVCYGLLNRLAQILAVPLDLDDIQRAGDYLYDQVSRAINQKVELRDYVKQLEQDYIFGKLGMSAPPGKDVIKEVEDYLKERRSDR